RVLQEGRRLVAEHIVGQTKQDGDTAYVQDPFYQANKKQIINLVHSPKKREAYPSKRSQGGAKHLITVGKQSDVQAEFLTIDQIDSFDKVHGTAPIMSSPLSESAFKSGLQSILREEGAFKDWGGEEHDLFSTRLRIDGRRYRAAFALKGPAHSGKLKPSGM